MMEAGNRKVSYLWKSLLKKWRESTRENTGRKSDMSAATSLIHRLASIKKKGSQKPELLRAKTMPVINVASVLTPEELLQHGVRVDPSPTRTSSTPSSSSSTSSKSGRRFMRKMSYPESYFRWLTQRRPSSSPSTSDTGTGPKTTRTQRPRSQSEHRLWKTRRKSDSVRLESSWSLEEGIRSATGLLDDARSTLQQLYSTPPKSNMVRSASSEKRLETSSSAGNLQKLSRQLAMRERKEPQSPPRNRSISLDWGDNHGLKLFSSASQESAMDVVSSLSVSPSAPAYLSYRDEQGYSPKLRRDLKLLTNSQKKKSPSIDSYDGQILGKRKLEKEKRALFDAVEQQDLDLTKTLLENLTVDINSLNAESLTVLDIAVMTNNIPMAKMLLSRGARESLMFQRGECRLQRLESLVMEAEKRVIDLTASVLSASSGNANISPAQMKENEKQLGHWEFRHKLLKRMRAGYEHAKPPEAPTNVRLEVTGESSLLVTFAEPQSHNGAVVTKYKAEWSTHDQFEPIAGEIVVDNLSCMEAEIKNLKKGIAYYVRVCAYNMKGFGTFSNSDPVSAVPSNWREVENIPSRLEGKVASLYTLYHQVKRSRPPDTAEMKDILNKGTESPMQKKRISIKNLFLSAPKFQKTIKRGVYMACLFYCEDKILVTSDEQLPVIEVDETFSGPSIQTDLYWLLKISCMWEDVKIMKQDMEKTSSAGSTFRCKLLSAILVLQTALGIQDLGQFFHRSIRDCNNSIIFTVVNQIRDPKLVTLSSSKWVTFGKLARRQSLSAVDMADAHSLLVSAVPEMILYHQVSGLHLSRGLYLGYIKLQASVEVLRVLVPNKTPNCVPHVKVRNCPNVSREEWEWILQYHGHMSHDNLTNGQKNFKHHLAEATKKLFAQLDLPEESITSHRIYDLEVLELSPSVTMILIMPSIMDICIVPGQSDSLAKRADLTFLPVQIFESIHMQAYLPEFFSLYARLSAIVEMDGVLAQQGHREAFSSEELTKAKEQVQVTASLQQNLDKIWKCARWIRDITTYARNRDKVAGIHLSHVIKNTASGANFSNENNQPVCTLRSHGTGGHSSHLFSTSALCRNKMNRRSDSFESDHRHSHEFYNLSDGEINSSYSIRNENDSLKAINQDSSPTFDSLATSRPSSQQISNFSQVSPSPSLTLTDTSLPSSYSMSTESAPPLELASAIIKVHALYETGLNKNVNIKLHITEQTTSRDIINLVVRHLNTIVRNKGRQAYVYSEESLVNFCLVLKFQGHKKVLRDDYKLLRLKDQLQKAKVCITFLESVFSEEDLGQASFV